MDDSDEEWEPHNDDGFVYWRKKRRLQPSEPHPQPPAEDSEADERYRRERKKKTLLKIEDRYQRELALWEHLSNKCRAMQEKAVELRRERGTRPASSAVGSLEKEASREGRQFGPLIDKLLLQAETQEAINEDVSKLCEVAEALCCSQEEQFKQSLIDLPIWCSPGELMAMADVLSDDD